MMAKHIQIVTVDGENHNTMRTSIRYLLVSCLIAGAAWAEPIDKPIAVTSRDQVFLKLGTLRTELSSQAGLDLVVAVRAIERHCDALSDDLNKDERDRLFVALIDGRTGREIILAGASLLISESAQLSVPAVAVDVTKLSEHDLVHRKQLMFNRSIGLNFVKLYTPAAKEVRGTPTINH